MKMKYFVFFNDPAITTLIELNFLEYGNSSLCNIAG